MFPVFSSFQLEPTSRPPYQHEPVLFRAGILTCQLPGGKLTSAALRSHNELAVRAPGGVLLIVGQGEFSCGCCAF